MGIERTFSPEHSRKRAEEFRTKADNLEHRESRDTLVRAAKAYDDLARRAEEVRTLRDASEENSVD